MCERTKFSSSGCRLSFHQLNQCLRVEKKKNLCFQPATIPPFVFAETESHCTCFPKEFSTLPAAAICGVMEPRRGCRALPGGGRHETWTPFAPAQTPATLTLCTWPPGNADYGPEATFHAYYRSSTAVNKGGPLCSRPRVAAARDASP